jgi:hypothetical protein
LDELGRQGLRHRPHVWLAEEWFSPDGVPGFAVPFYLAHPRLIKLERKLMLDVEGGSEQECMRILRHEAGHAIDNAYRLHYRRRWRELYSMEWPAFYDRDLRRVFVSEPARKSHPSAAAFLRSRRRDLCERVSRATGVHPYTVNQILQNMIERCRKLKLRVTLSPREGREQALLMLTMHTTHVAHVGYCPVAV